MPSLHEHIKIIGRAMKELDECLTRFQEYIEKNIVVPKSVRAKRGKRSALPTDEDVNPEEIK